MRETDAVQLVAEKSISCYLYAGELWRMSYQSKDGVAMIRDVHIHDVQAICTIYNHYVSQSIVTFEEQAVSIHDMTARIEDIAHELPWLVAENQGMVSGFAFASKWKGRCAYRYAVESTIYLSPSSIGMGIGTKLYVSLLERLRMLSFHCVLGGIALPNPASVSLHEKLGFKKVAHFKEVGWKADRWIDVGYWELLL